MSDFFHRESARHLPQDGLAGLKNLEPHGRAGWSGHYSARSLLIPGVMLRTGIAIFHAVIEVIVANGP